MRSFVQSALIYIVIGCVGVGVAVTLPPSAVSASSKAKQRGAELFAERGCAHCHGPNGIGGKHGPNLQLVRKHMNKAQIRLQIQKGGMMMPAFGTALTPPQIEDLIAYLRAKRKIIVATPQPHTETLSSVTSLPDNN